MPAGECRTLSGGREQGLVHRVRASSQERQVLVGARGMGVGDERKLHHGEDEAEDEDEEQHNDAAGLPAAMSGQRQPAQYCGPAVPHKRNCH